MAIKKLCDIIFLTIALLWISCISSQFTCGLGCKECLLNNNCLRCLDGFYRYNISQNRCFHCPQGCSTCYLDTICYDCKDGYYMKKDNVCAKCFEGCLKCVNNVYECNHQCKSGRWGETCQYSCTTCSECVNDLCKDNCRDYEQSSKCYNGNIVCPDQKCSFIFVGLRKSDTVSSTSKTNVTTRATQATTSPPTSTKKTLISTTTSTTQSPTATRGTQQSTTTRRTLPPITKRRTLPPTTKRRTLSTTTKRKTLPPTTNRRTLPYTRTQRRTTSFTGHDITSKQSESTVYSEQPDARANKDGKTEQTESKTDDLDPTVVYILIAVVGVLVLTIVVGTVVIVCIKRRNSRKDPVTCPHDTTNKDSHQLADNAGVYSYVSNLGNTICNLPTINVAGSGTRFADMKAAAYVNVVDKTALNTSDTVHTHEAFNQYTNVREAQNKHTSLTCNENLYYNVLD